MLANSYLIGEVEPGYSFGSRTHRRNAGYPTVAAANSPHRKEADTVAFGFTSQRKTRVLPRGSGDGICLVLHWS